MNGKIRVIYIGYHIETLLLLYADKRFHVAGTGLIDEFLSSGTLNPVNALFKLIYGLRRRNQYRLLEKILLWAWIKTSRFATSFYYRYSEYLKALSESATVLVDFSNSREAMDFIASNSVDVMVVCSWSILSDEIVTLPKYGTVNIHPSKLPQYRGALPTLWSLKNGDRESAVTYFIINKAVDAGAIIGQHAFSLGEGDDWHCVENKIDGILRATLLSDLNGYIGGEIKPITQDMRIKSNTGRYYEYMKIDWDNENGNDIYNKVNLYPFIVPGDYCYTFINGKKIVIKKAGFNNSQAVLPKAGHYQVRGITLCIQAKLGTIDCGLFSGLLLKDSLLFLLKRKGNFDTSFSE
jgi:methionyl-tRNA formyltransferase